MTALGFQFQKKSNNHPMQTTPSELQAAVERLSEWIETSAPVSESDGEDKFLNDIKVVLSTLTQLQKQVVELTANLKELSQRHSWSESQRLLRDRVDHALSPSCGSDYVHKSEVEKIQLLLDEAQQWLDSEPDWKDKFMKAYSNLEKDRDSLTQANTLLKAVAKVAKHISECKLPDDALSWELLFATLRIALSTAEKAGVL